MYNTTGYEPRIVKTRSTALAHPLTTVATTAGSEKDKKHVITTACGGASIYTLRVRQEQLSIGEVLR